MTKLTKDEIELADSMTIKQRRVLWALSIYPGGWYMSASERADPELREMFKHKLVQCHHTAAGGGLPAWGATEFGKRVADRQAKGAC